MIGTVSFRPNELVSGRTINILNKLKNPIATLMVDQYQVRTQYEFGDFLQKGLQLALVECIDFTASNGIANDKSSLHFTRNGPSKY